MPSYSVHLHTGITLDAPVERLWPIISDTDRVNRMIGLPAFERARPDGDFVQTISGHYFGVPVSWQEHPFEWVFEQRFAVERAFHPPIPVERLRTLTRLAPRPDGRTQVDVEVHVAPRNLLGRLAGQLLIGQKLLRDLLHAYRKLGALAAAPDMAPPPPRPPACDARRLAAAVERLRASGARPALVARLSEHLRTADDAAVVRMRPFALADRWGEPRMEVLRLFLHATHAGLLDMEWDVICPSCRGPSRRLRTLGEVDHAAYCPSCDVRYDVNFDESIELRFSAHPDIRVAEDLSYCIGGPANTPHIAAQIMLPAHGTRELRLRLLPGGYRLRSRHMLARADLDCTPAAAARAAHIVFGQEQATIDVAAVAPGEVTLTLENAVGAPALLVIERREWSAQAATAALVTSIAEFRRLFSSEALAPGLGIAVRSLTFVFSDLKDSTAIYERLGDSPAYARVRDHFELLQAIVAVHDGTLVKTIGDAVMAVFASSEHAVEAALAIQREFAAWAAERGEPPLQIKIGAHRGPCIAVSANDVLDYFGSTVNVAARTLGVCEGGDVVITEAVLEDPGVREVLERAAAEIEPLRRALKGLTPIFTLYRLRRAALAAAALPTAGASPHDA